MMLQENDAGKHVREKKTQTKSFTIGLNAKQSM